MEISEQEYNELKACERICNGMSYTVTLTQEQIDKLNILSNSDGNFAMVKDLLITANKDIYKLKVESKLIEIDYKLLVSKVYAFNYSFIGRLFPIKI